MKTYLLPENIRAAAVQVIASITHSTYTFAQLSEVLTALRTLQDAPPAATETAHESGMDTHQS